MPEKKEPTKFTIQFHEGDPTHQQVAEILNRQGRRKAQFLVNAVQHYLHCSETPDIPQKTLRVDTQEIERIVRQILSERNSAVPAHETDSFLDKTEKVEKIDRAGHEPPEIDELSALARSLAMFRNR